MWQSSHKEQEYWRCLHSCTHSNDHSGRWPQEDFSWSNISLWSHWFVTTFLKLSTLPKWHLPRWYFLQQQARYWYSLHIASIDDYHYHSYVHYRIHHTHPYHELQLNVVVSMTWFLQYSVDSCWSKFMISKLTSCYKYETWVPSIILRVYDSTGTLTHEQEDK